MVWRVFCLVGWIVSVAVEFFHVQQLPAKVDMLGFDVTHSVAILVAHQLVWMLVGLVSAALGFLRNVKYSFLGTMFSCVLYFVWRYGPGTLRHGLLTDWRMKWVVASSYHLEPTFYIQDVAMPIVFVVVAVMTIHAGAVHAPTSTSR